MSVIINGKKGRKKEENFEEKTFFWSLHVFVQVRPADDVRRAFAAECTIEERWGDL